MNRDAIEVHIIGLCSWLRFTSKLLCIYETVMLSNEECCTVMKLFSFGVSRVLQLYFQCS
jgi:hypothetical protein